MSPIGSASRAIGTLVTHNNGSKMLMRSVGKNIQHGNGKVFDVRCFSSSIAGVKSTTPFVERKKMIENDNKEIGCSFSNMHQAVQARRFLGCSDGEEGNALSKVYEEKRVLGYSPEQLFGVVAAVDMYEDFVPWCQRSKIVRRNPDGSFDAELEIGFKYFVESYTSHVELKKPKFIKTTESESNLFDQRLGVQPWICSRILQPLLHGGF